MPLPDESLNVSRSSADAEVTVIVGTASEQKETRTPLWTWPVLVVAVRAPLTSRRCSSKCGCKCASFPIMGLLNVTEGIHRMLHSFWQGKFGCLEEYKHSSQCLHYADHVGLLSSISIQDGWRCPPGDSGLLAPSIDRAAATPRSCDTVLAALSRSAAVSCCPTSASRNTSSLVFGARCQRTCFPVLLNASVVHMTAIRTCMSGAAGCNDCCWPTHHICLLRRLGCCSNALGLRSEAKDLRHRRHGAASRCRSTEALVLLDGRRFSLHACML